ncbi:helix-turn-helix domain-containing protein [Streptococcus oralis subsp. dentisani]|uniref:Helix-turn-helix domain-containing protein n=2 Tax=Streptococcus TaxID=1301 RepID=A0A1X1J974_STROR|nr:helix-turn-helix domain-containing protein [Streptococcus oralis subsp. dentisani]
MLSMRKKTIGEVLRLARINQGLSIEELQAKTDIQMNLLEAMEADDFDQLPSTFYARSFLRKYAWAVELDERIILDAYDSGSMITYEEVDVDEEDLSGRRRSNKKKTSYLPLFYFVLFALSILIFVTYYVWNYIQTQPTRPSSPNYSIVSSTSSTTSTSSSSSSQTSSSSSTTESTITVSGEGNRIEARYKTSKETATVQLAVSDVTSWVSVSGSELEGGVTLSADNKNEKTTVSTKNPVAITLGVVKGVTVTVDNQTVDTSKLTTQTGTVTLTFTTD